MIFHIAYVMMEIRGDSYMKKFIPIVLAVILLFSGCTVPKTESVPSGSSSLPSGSSASSVVISSLPTETAVPMSENSVVSVIPSEPSTVSEDIGEPMTQAEFDDFFENVLPQVMILLGGEETYDPNDSVEIDGVTYYKITDEKYNTVGKLKAELAKYFITEDIDDEINRLFINHIPAYQNYMTYTEKDGFVYVHPKTVGANREFDKKLFYREDESEHDTIDLVTVKNGTDPFINYYFWVKRENGEWKIDQADCDVYPADGIVFPRMGKPVLYLYPETVADVTVKLDLNGKLGCTYPSYPKDGWQVTAYPSGKLIVDGEEYNYLFWEGELNTVFTFDKGFCVKGEDTAAFLKKALSEMGLIPSEYNDFIVYWLPKMEENAYNLISFVGKEYIDNAKLEISPKPDSVLRVAMAYQPLEQPVEIVPQTFEPFERNGFTVVEWGGAEID